MLLDMSLLETTRVDAELIGPCGVDFSVPIRQSEMSIEAMLRRWQQCFQENECCYELPISVTRRHREAEASRGRHCVKPTLRQPPPRESASSCTI